jgi:hypothetical protein
MKLKKLAPQNKPKFPPKGKKKKNAIVFSLKLSF